MYLMYVDESGDPGLINSPTPIFALTGLVLHELRWRDTLQEVVAFRRRMRDAFGLKIREEIHASPFINRPGDLVRIKRNVQKAGKPEGYDPHLQAWRTLLQRFENTISKRNFPGPAAQDERGVVIVDGDQSGGLVRIIRRMRHYNVVPSQYGGTRNLPVKSIIEDAIFRDSRHSMLIQAADVAAYLLYQQENPNSYMRKSSGHQYFKRMASAFNLHAAPHDPQGVVRL